MKYIKKYEQSTEKYWQLPTTKEPYFSTESMKYIKTFENVNIPQEDDYIVCNKDILEPTVMNSLNLEEGFFIENVGKIYWARDKYKNYTEYGNDKNFIVSSDDIAFFSPNKEDVEAFINSKKYNL